ncbi:uncharacterized protein Z519_00252 [Cladophialophora bantiana CBS 173.52]|uniref:Uncharacterized protein n=1 Tax=Cladophialophora bantiana (strain ATCC 10958 / CBS 173.52 / CDC B-1940 / NIH 8579) TaxID=1442370 RepID=A0A0D2F932_CLAB1|nr:uncharacterized protein Z519_00252 [Cladophialophora bantiana CBS 173.52]KIW98591.1 hypothetical protein Z519_00252 [Cladophialophora bantiana CBS 173.52]
MSKRRNRMEERIIDFGETYRWIFNPPEEMKKHKFIDWLQTGKDILGQWKAWIRKIYTYGFGLSRPSSRRGWPWPFGGVGKTPLCSSAQLLVLQTSLERFTEIIARFLEITLLSDPRHGRDSWG